MEPGDKYPEENCSADEIIAGSLDHTASAFNAAIGHLEDIMISDAFQQLQNSFVEEYCYSFDESSENKFFYTDIHLKYVDVVERFLEEELKRRMPLFDMAAFLALLNEHRDELDGEVFEMLYTFTDFTLFKDMMLDQKKAKTGATIDLALTNSYFVCPSNQVDPMLLMHSTIPDGQPSQRPSGAKGEHGDEPSLS